MQTCLSAERPMVPSNIAIRDAMERLLSKDTNTRDQQISKPVDPVPKRIGGIGGKTGTDHD
jgi:hypothetical protein